MCIIIKYLIKSGSDLTQIRCHAPPHEKSLHFKVKCISLNFESKMKRFNIMNSVLLLTIITDKLPNIL